MLSTVRFYTLNTWYNLPGTAHGARRKGRSINSWPGTISSRNIVAVNVYEHRISIYKHRDRCRVLSPTLYLNKDVRLTKTRWGDYFEDFLHFKTLQGSRHVGARVELRNSLQCHADAGRILPHRLCCARLWTGDIGVSNNCAAERISVAPQVVMIWNCISCLSTTLMVASDCRTWLKVFCSRLSDTFAPSTFVSEKISLFLGFRTQRATTKL